MTKAWIGKRVRKHDEWGLVQLTLPLNDARGLSRLLQDTFAVTSPSVILSIGEAERLRSLGEELEEVLGE